jgi:dihydropteroate synthase
MGIVNASPDSFSGDGSVAAGAGAELARAAWQAGATIIDLGGQSANTATPELDVEEEIRRLVPLVEATRAVGDGAISVDTYKPAVADACLAAGADIVNDVSGLFHAELADVVASWGAGYVLMHTVGPPKSKVLDPDLYDDVADRVLAFFADGLDRLAAAGVAAEQVALDPGIDFGKTPRQSLEILAGAGRLAAATDRPLLFALSRKDFIGAATHTSPLQRGPGTLATVGAVAAAAPDSIVRVHDVAATVQYLTVRTLIADPSLLAPDAQLPGHLRREAVPG